jgi:hypothetical protein
MGLYDGLSKLWILRTPDSALDIDGHEDEFAAIDALVRHILIWHGDAPETKARIEATVREALKHCDESDDAIDRGGDEGAGPYP